MRQWMRPGRSGPCLVLSRQRAPWAQMEGMVNDLQLARDNQQAFEDWRQGQPSTSEAPSIPPPQLPPLALVRCLRPSPRH